jgi:hypothetical protein
MRRSWCETMGVFLRAPINRSRFRLHNLVLVDFGSVALFFGILPDNISSFTFFKRLNSSIHSSSVKLLTFGTLTVLSSQLFASPDQK